jgi:phosphonate transport system substrate-binding protein
MTQKSPKQIVSAAFIGLLCVAVGAVVTYWYVSQKNISENEAADVAKNSEALRQSMGMVDTNHVLSTNYTDADNDGVADTPADASKQINPETVTFSYVGGDPTGNEKTWADLLAHLKKTTGKNFAYLPAATIDDQLVQLQSGKLHITVINSGAVPLAVTQCGFVPAYTIGDSKYSMQIIVPADSNIKGVKDIRMLTLVDTKSNSGYKLPLLLMKEKNLFPEVDYQINFSMGQKKSIAGIAARTFEAAAVASDLLRREEAAGTIKPTDYKVIYTSQAYPQAAVGFAYNLSPDLAKKIREGMESFDFAASELNKEFAAAHGKFVKTNYAKDWEGVRKVANSFKTREKVEGPAVAATQSGEK